MATLPFRLAPPVSRALRLPVAAALLAAASITWPGAASADQQSSVQAQIAALQAQLSATGRQVHSLTFAYTSAQVEVASLGQQLAADQARAQQAAAAAGRAVAALRQEVLDAYMGDSSDPTAGTTGRGIADPAVRYGYISIATSGVQDSLDSYRAARVALSSALATVAAQQQAALAAAWSVDRARSAALTEASQASTRLAGLESQLATLEQQAAAAQAAAARAAATRSSSTPPPAPVTRTQGGPVNGGLVAVVRAQVAAAPPPAPVAPPTTPATTAPAVTLPPAPSTTLAPPAPVAAPPAPSQPAGSADVWLQLRECESGNDYQANTGNGFYGAYQFSQQTWTDLGYPGRPDLEPPAMQDQAAQQLQAQSGWGQWPACSAALGLT